MKSLLKALSEAEASRVGTQAPLIPEALHPPQPPSEEARGLTEPPTPLLPFTWTQDITPKFLHHIQRFCQGSPRPWDRTQ